MRRTIWIGVCLGIALLSAGCAKAPREEIDAAKGALASAAESKDVEAYAPESLAAARSAEAAMEAELTLQKGKSALTRKYARTKQLAADAKKAAELAVADAAAAKERARDEARQTIDAARKEVIEVKGRLGSMPKGKGTAADIAAIRSDMDDAESSLTSAESTFAQGDFLEAKAQAEAILATAQRTRDDIDQAVQLAKGKRR